MEPRPPEAIPASYARSPQPYVRAGGLMYLAIIALGLFGELAVRGAVAGPGLAAAIAANQTLWRVGIATDLLMHLLDVPLIVVFYLLLRPIDQPLALLAAVFNVIQTAVLATNKLMLVVPLLLLDAPALAGPPAEALVRIALNVHAYGFGIGLVFFGLSCLVLGHLLRRSKLVPGFLGTLMQLAGACYVVNSGALILWPALAGALFPWILLPCLVGELALAAWMLVKGIDLAQWRAAQFA